MGWVKNGRVKNGQVKNGRVKNDLIPNNDDIEQIVKLLEKGWSNPKKNIFSDIFNLPLIKRKSNVKENAQN